MDTESLSSFTEFLVDGGVHSLFPCSSIGEFSSLSQNQRLTVLETVIDHAGTTPVLAGCGGTSVGEVKPYIQDANRAGADAAVVVTPYYLQTSTKGLVNLYEHLVADAPLPIILYDIPSLTGNHLSVEAVTNLAKH